jgi:hypothetical protein
VLIIFAHLERVCFCRFALCVYFCSFFCCRVHAHIHTHTQTHATMRQVLHSSHTPRRRRRTRPLQPCRANTWVRWRCKPRAKHKPRSFQYVAVVVVFWLFFFVANALLFLFFVHVCIYIYVCVCCALCCLVLFHFLFCGIDMVTHLFSLAVIFSTPTLAPTPHTTHPHPHLLPRHHTPHPPTLPAAGGDPADAGIVVGSPRRQRRRSTSAISPHRRCRHVRWRWLSTS